MVRTGNTVAWAFRGYNPHQKDPSYYPLVAHVAQTGHILRLKNRPGNVHDCQGPSPSCASSSTTSAPGSAGAWPWSSAWTRPFSRRRFCICWPRGLRLRDQGRLLELAPAQDARRRAAALDPVAPVTAYETALRLDPWDLRLRVVLYRKHVHHETRKNFQLDLFTPDDGHYEYSAVATNLPLALPPSGPSPRAAAPRRRPSPSSKASSPSTWSRPSTTRPTAPYTHSGPQESNSLLRREEYGWRG